MKIVRTKIKGCGHKTMKFNETEPDFYSMPRLQEQEQEQVSTATSSSSIGAHTVDTQSTATSSTTEIVTLDHQSSSSPSLSSGNCNVYPPNTMPPTTSIMMANHSRHSSLGSTETTSSTNFINDLNRSIQLNELAIVCSALCNLRKGTML